MNTSKNNTFYCNYFSVFHWKIMLCNRGYLFIWEFISDNYFGFNINVKLGRFILQLQLTLNARLYEILCHNVFHFWIIFMVWLLLTSMLEYLILQYCYVLMRSFFSFGHNSMLYSMNDSTIYLSTVSKIQSMKWIFIKLRQYFFKCSYFNKLWFLLQFIQQHIVYYIY